MDADGGTDFGALVGWTANRIRERLALRMQSVITTTPHTKKDVHTFTFVMTREQAVQLGEFLFKMAGQTPSARKRNWFERIFSP